MSIDFEAIKKKLNKLNRNATKQNVFWKPTGEHTIRIVPMKGDPFRELWFYYFFENGSILAPGPTRKEADPVADFADSLRKEGTDESRAQARSIAPKMRAYVPVIVRGEEDQGVRWFGIGRKAYEQLLGHIMDPEYGDITDPLEGRDIKVVYKKITATGYPETTLNVKPKTSRLTEDAQKSETLMNNIPDLDEFFESKSYEELSNMLQQWLSGANKSNGDGTVKTVTNSDATDDDESLTDVDNDKASKLDDALSSLLQ